MTGLTGVQQDTLRRMARNAEPWCLPARTRDALLQRKFVRASKKKCKEHGGVRMVELTPEGWAEAQRLAK